MSVGTMARSARGVTLIELMIAVAIVGILAAVAYPSYQAQVRRGNRTEGKQELMEAAQELEKCYTRYGRYAPTAVNLCQAYDTIAGVGRLSETGRYTITFVGNPDRNTYTLQAILARGNDPECPTLTLNQSNRRGVRSGGADVTDAARIQRCW